MEMDLLLGGVEVAGGSAWEELPKVVEPKEDFHRKPVAEMDWDSRLSRLSGFPEQSGSFHFGTAWNWPSLPPVKAHLRLETHRHGESSLGHSE